mmetsp:Transcript_13132/g.26789  ORF Transcript_13132/g.26789 Transcript_13132/m.26789 type:complete len:351 (-) Transcript_13132:78-1130(-)
MSKVKVVPIADAFKDEIRDYVQFCNKEGYKPPKLVGILATSDPAASQYASWTGRAFLSDGLRYSLITVSDPTHVEGHLKELEKDDDVSGIIIYYPCFGQQPSYSGESMDDYLRDSVPPQKDVEGLCWLYRKSLYSNVRYLDDDPKRKCVLPCTALSVVKILEDMEVAKKSNPEGRRMEGLTVTIVNRSEIVGRPLAAMLANDGATVYSVDIDSIYKFGNGKLERMKCGRGKEECVRESDVVVLGVPSKDYKLSTSWVKPNAVVVNVASYKNYDESTILSVPGVRVVGMVGKVTVKMLERNLCRLHRQYRMKDVRGGEDGKEIGEVKKWTMVAAGMATIAAVVGIYNARRR